MLENCPDFILLYVALQFYQHYLLKRLCSSSMRNATDILIEIAMNL